MRMKIGTFIKNGSVINALKVLQKDDYKARGNGLAVLRCHPQEAGEKKNVCSHVGISVPELPEVATYPSLLTVGVFLGW